MGEPAASRHALITGAGKRVGAALARDLAAGGWAVTIHHRTSEQAAVALARSIRADGGVARTVSADFSRPQDAVAMIQAVEAEGPPVSLLVNSAAAFVYDAAGSLTLDNLNAHFLVNCAAPILMAQAFHAEKARRQQSGAVVNILDNKIFAPNADYFSYSVSKLALAGATRMLAMALAPLVRVCGVAPSVLLVSGEQTEEDFYRTNAVNPMRRATDLADICRTVRFLAETESVNGEIITVDRGQTLMNLPRDIAFLDDSIIKSLQWPRP
jgi:NAD(P)-dependent dehydrogenase (short-subunit alcohol dehydrogenase family)